MSEREIVSWTGFKGEKSEMEEEGKLELRSLNDSALQKCLEILAFRVGREKTRGRAAASSQCPRTSFMVLLFCRGEKEIERESWHLGESWTHRKAGKEAIHSALCV